MPRIELETKINSPVERVFDLARCIDLHTQSMDRSREKAVGGVTSGLINLGETVTWQAVHFGVRQNLISSITLYDRPRHFRDSMVIGAFKRLDHDHFFSEVEDGTLMRDVFDYTSPLGLLGAAADKLFLKAYMTRLLAERNAVIKRVAENEEWKKFIS
jgi:ligand-binding SRPBCC domain-containing protein